MNHVPICTFQFVLHGVDYELGNTDDPLGVYIYIKCSLSAAYPQISSRPARSCF